MEKPQASDQELRIMRNFVYPPIGTNPATIQTNSSWEHVKHNWRKDEAWLTAEYNKLRKKP